MATASLSRRRSFQAVYPLGSTVRAAENRGGRKVRSGPIRTRSRIRWGRCCWRQEGRLHPISNAEPVFAPLSALFEPHDAVMALARGAGRTA